MLSVDLELLSNIAPLQGCMGKMRERRRLLPVPLMRADSMATSPGICTPRKSISSLITHLETISALFLKQQCIN